MSNIVRVISLILTQALLLNILIISSGTGQVHDISFSETREYKDLLNKLQEYRKVLATGDSLEIAEACYLVGKRYIGINNILKAREWFLRSAKIREPLHDFYELGKVYDRLVECEVRLADDGSINQLINYSRLSQANFFKAGTLRGLMVGFRQMAVAHHCSWGARQRKKEIINFTPSLDSAIYYLKKSLKIAMYLNSPIDIALNYQHLSGTSYDKNDIVKSIYYKKKALSIYQKEKKVPGIVDNCIFIGRDYIDLNQLSLGEAWLDKSKYIADTSHWNSVEYRIKLAEAYYLLYTRRDDLAEAIRYQKEAYDYKILAEKAYHETTLESINLSNQVEKHEAQLQSKQEELANQHQKAKLRFWLIVLISALLVVAAFAGIFYYGLFKKYRILSKVNARLVQEQSHRFNNNLQKISDLLHMQQIEIADPMAVLALEESQLRVEAVALVHKLLYGGEELVRVEVATYIPDLIEGVLQSYGIEHVTVDYELDHVLIHVDQAITVGLIVTELATNACKYALANNEDPRLNISYKKLDKNVVLSFRDNGSGFNKNTDNSSFGLNLVELLVLNLKGNAVFTSDQGTCFHLSFKTDIR